MSESEGDRSNLAKKGLTAPVAEFLGLEEAQRAGLEKAVTGVVRRTVVRRSMFPEFAEKVGDTNPLHLSADYARDEYGLEDTPAHATFLAADGEQYALDVADAINSFVKEGGDLVVPTGLGFTFVGLALPEQVVYWNPRKFTAVRTDDEDPRAQRVMFQFRGSSDKRCSDSLLTVKAQYGFTRPTLPATDLVSEFLQRPDVVPAAHSLASISEDDVASFYRCINECAPGALNPGKARTEREEVPWGLVGARIPSALLALAAEKFGKPEGVYTRVEFRLYNPPRAGTVRTYIARPNDPVSARMPGEEGKQGLKYTFRGLCLQQAGGEGEDEHPAYPILSGRVVVLSPRDEKISF